MGWYYMTGDPVSFVELPQAGGKKLMDFAINQLKADKVDVNEQNNRAVKFYPNLEFKVYERTKE
ncbi:MAG: hypothetical protein ACNS62_17955 [Candidatus Cyclobacteriaceae bacterium M3_2C_046]